MELDAPFLGLYIVVVVRSGLALLFADANAASGELPAWEVGRLRDHSGAVALADLSLFDDELLFRDRLEVGGLELWELGVSIVSVSGPGAGALDPNPLIRPRLPPALPRRLPPLPLNPWNLLIQLLRQLRVNLLVRHLVRLPLPFPLPLLPHHLHLRQPNAPQIVRRDESRHVLPPLSRQGSLPQHFSPALLRCSDFLPWGINNFIVVLRLRSMAALSGEFWSSNSMG